MGSHLRATLSQCWEVVARALADSRVHVSSGRRQRPGREKGRSSKLALYKVDRLGKSPHSQGSSVPRRPEEVTQQKSLLSMAGEGRPLHMGHLSVVVQGGDPLMSPSWAAPPDSGTPPQEGAGGLSPAVDTRCSQVQPPVCTGAGRPPGPKQNSATAEGPLEKIFRPGRREMKT